jgi:N-acetylglucosamine-6-sulfatase
MVLTCHQPSGASWISKLEKLNDTVIASHDEWHVGRLQSLQSVDELVDQVVKRLEKYNLLDNTYIIFTSDNGYHIGQHRLQPGKTCAFEEDINVPFYVRGPNVPKGKTVDVVTTHTDIVPTLFELAGIEQRDDFDGQPIPVTSKAIAEQLKNKKRDHVNVEFWGPGRGEGTYGGKTYCATQLKYFAKLMTSQLMFRTTPIRLYVSLESTTISCTLCGARTSTSFTT